MTKLTLCFLSALAGITIDALTKKAAENNTLINTLIHPYMVWIYLLCIAQVICGCAAFVYKWELAAYSNYYSAFFALASIFFGMVFFKENLSIWQYAGIATILLGSYLLWQK